MTSVIVAGLGAMGSAAAYHLARAGARVVGLDRYAPPHAWGSSHGRSRIIREAYFEDPLYVPLVRRAYELWEALERDSGRTLWTRTGGLMLGAADSAVVTGALRSAQEHGLPHDLLDAAGVMRRVPAWRVPSDHVGVWEPRAGFLDPERAVETHLAGAIAHGAVIHTDEAVTAWRAEGDGVAVTTTRGTYRADRLVLAAGAWLTTLVDDAFGARLSSLAVERMAQLWFRPPRATSLFAPDRFPIFIAEFAPGRIWYGFPDAGYGVKAALHHGGERVDAETVRRTVRDDEVETVRELLRAHLPDADGPLVDTAVCLYTNTPDEHFIVDRHPEHAQVVVVSACSGHGFKFSTAIGDVLADLALDRAPRFDLAPFRLARLV